MVGEHWSQALHEIRKIVVTILLTLISIVNIDGQVSMDNDPSRQWHGWNIAQPCQSMRFYCPSVIAKGVSEDNLLRAVFVAANHEIAAMKVPSYSPISSIVLGNELGQLGEHPNHVGFVDILRSRLGEADLLDEVVTSRAHICLAGNVAGPHSKLISKVGADFRTQIVKTFNVDTSVKSERSHQFHPGMEYAALALEIRQVGTIAALFLAEDFENVTVFLDRRTIHTSAQNIDAFFSESFLEVVTWSIALCGGGEGGTDSFRNLSHFGDSLLAMPSLYRNRSSGQTKKAKICVK